MHFAFQLAAAEPAVLWVVVLAAIVGVVTGIMLWGRLHRVERQTRRSLDAFETRLERLEQRERASTTPRAESPDSATEPAASPSVSARSTQQRPEEPRSDEPTGPPQPTPLASDHRATEASHQTPGSVQTAACSDGPNAETDAAAGEATIVFEDDGENEPVVEPEPASGGVEERLGTKVFIWIGGVALVLAGVFLVKYSFENALLSPSARVGLGVVFGAALLIGGEWMRPRSARIGEALAGAGVAVLYGCLLAATTLYELIGPGMAFVAMAILTGGAVFLSLKHGPFVALLGLIGGFATPPLIGEGVQATLPLLGYLLLLEIGMTAVARRRGWVGLTGLTLLGSIAWAGILMATGLTEANRFALEVFLVASAGVYVVGATGFAAGGRPSGPTGLLTAGRIAGTAVGAVIVLMGVLAAGADFELMDLAMLGLTGAGVLVLARLRSGYGGLAWLAGAASAGAVLAWSVPMLWGGGRDEAAMVERFGWVVVSFGLLYAGGSYLALWRSSRAGVWSAASVTAAIGYLLVARIGLVDATVPGWFAWWHVALPLGIVYGAAALPVWARRGRMQQSEAALGALAVGSAVLLAIAVQTGLDFQWRLSAWAGLAAGCACMVRRQHIEALDAVAALLSLLVMVSAVVPGPSAMAYGPTPVVNALLPAYAIPAAALALAAWWLGDEARPTRRQAASACALGVAAFGGWVLIRHGFHPRSVLHGPVGLYEWATYAVAGLIGALGLFAWDLRRPEPVRRGGALCLTGLGGFAAIAGAGLLANPLAEPHAVGSWPVLNGLFYAYGAPAVLFALLGSVARRYDWPALGLTSGLAALAMVFALVSLEVRQAFVGSVLSQAPVSMGEWYAYSVAWIGLGIVLVVGGIATGSRALRYGSLLVMVVAIGKVFLLDTARLEDLYRVLSLLGLGVSLMGLGYLYQRFVFRRPAIAGRSADDAGEAPGDPERG